MFHKKISLTFLLFIFILTPNIVGAVSAFDPHYIISDYDMRNNSSWTVNDVQKFLEAKNSYLTNYSTVDAIDKKPKLASGIIYDAASRYNINPKVLLVTLQKEQSLIESISPSKDQIDCAMGYEAGNGCSWMYENRPKWRGFAAQVDNAAYTFDWYLNNNNKSYLKKAGVPTIISGTTVIPKNKATAALYTYTPNLHGNKNFDKLWKTWFSSTYPNGTLLKSSANNDIYLIQQNLKRKFKNMTVLLTRANPKTIITVTDSELSKYETGKEITLPNYSILKSDNNYYLLDYDLLRPFASYEVVKKLGYNPQEIIEVTQNDINGIKLGTTITADAYAPQGIIYKLSDSNYYLIKNNNAYPLIDSSVAKTNFPNLTLKNKKSSDLKSFNVKDDFINFADGVLLKSDNKNEYYVMENGKKRKFENEKAFIALGYQKANAVDLNFFTYQWIPNGDPIYFSGTDVSELATPISSFLGDLATNVKDLYQTNLPSYVVAEYPSGKIISGKNIDTKRSIASFTKILVAHEAEAQGVDYSKIITYDSAKYNEGGFSLPIPNGSQLTNKDLMNTALIGSYNNIAKAVAQSTGLTEKQMIAKINERLKKWGVKNTNIADVTGLDKKNISTARELLKIFTYILKDDTYTDLVMGKPRHDFRTKQGKFYSIRNTNTMPFDNTNYKILASKTGYTDEALSVLMLLINSKIDNKDYMIITLGNPDYTNRLQIPSKIADWIATKGSSLNIAKK